MTRYLTALALAGALLVGASGCGSDEAAPLSGYERSPAPNVGDLSLPAVEADGAETDRALRPDSGDLLLVYFGYTSCPDVCPTTLADLRRALDDLGEDSSRIELAMVTIDPEVDTPEVLVGYVRSFVPSATALRTMDDAELREVAAGFGADYGKDLVDGESEVFHTASVYAVDSAGDLVLTWTFGTAADGITADMRQLLDRSA